MNSTKVCTKCLQEKQIEEFPWKNSFQGRRHAVCKPCMAERSSHWYEKNKDLDIQNVMLNKEYARLEARHFVLEYLRTHPCAICGENDAVVLEFDHIKEKNSDVARLVADGVSLERIQQEIDLCQVLCSNCHRRKTAHERGWFRQ